MQKIFETHVKTLQDLITDELKNIDPDIIVHEDLWSRNDHAGNPGGGGRTRAFSGKIIENAGVNTSTIFGEVDPLFSKSLGGNSTQVWATGISLIIHPYNPKVPTVHANFRMIVNGDKTWFGGGADLTPFFPNESEFKYFHKVWSDGCAPFGVYEKMKKECDEYFVNTHRGCEMRGIGGIFYDHWNSGNLENDFKMVNALSNCFIPSYFPIANRTKDLPFSEEDVEFQLHRRGRYVEFNLLHDRGTLFGLKTNGRTDSILISLPARCKFTYRYAPRNASPHEKMMEYYRPQNWI
jgi:coproporphyrinogen III oxidase